MKYQETCECCGGKVTAYTHQINKSLASALRQLVKFYQDSQIDERIAGMSCSLQKDLNLTHNQLANFQKLKYFGLVTNTGLSGKWLPTELGIKFIAGEAKVLTPVATLGGQVLPHGTKAWDTHKGKIKEVSVYDLDAEIFYKKREEYAEEKSSQGALNL